MTKRLASIALLLIYCLCSNGQQAPAGDISGPFPLKSNIYPGTERDYWLYVPKQYDKAKPACVMIVQDGLSCAKGWNLPAVLDSMIAAKAIPVTIGIFIDHGKVPATTTGSYPRYNRSFEYDGMGDRYARFLLEEMLPLVARSYNISNDPNDRLIAGASSGAICAFNAAWEKPGAFRRVFSAIGTYVGLRGADEFATLVRKTEPKPLRVFLEDGDHDLNIYGGDWWMANQGMLSALTWSGYEVNHAWGDGGHNGKHASAILPQALAWLWKDYPAPVAAHNGPERNLRTNIIIDNEPWQEIVTGKLTAEKLAVNKDGQLFFTSEEGIYTVNETGKISLYVKLPGTPDAICFDASGNLYVGSTLLHKIFSIDTKGKKTDIISNVYTRFITAGQKGIYFSSFIDNGIGFYNFSNRKIQHIPLKYMNPTGLALSAEQTFLNLAVSDDVFGYSFQIKEDGSLAYEQPYIHYHIPYGFTGSIAMGMTVDTANLLYTATQMGIQISDQLGRVNYIMPMPDQTVKDAKLGGAAFNTLYVTCNGRLFKRRLHTKGVLPYGTPVKPPKPGL